MTNSFHFFIKPGNLKLFDIPDMVVVNECRLYDSILHLL